MLIFRVDVCFSFVARELGHNPRDLARISASLLANCVLPRSGSAFEADKARIDSPVSTAPSRTDAEDVAFSRSSCPAVSLPITALCFKVHVAELRAKKAQVHHNSESVPRWTINAGL